MEQCFRIALWMFCLIGYLQAKPLSSQKAEQNNNPQGKPLSFIMADLGFKFLQNLSCEHNVTFTSPTKVQSVCHAAALKCFKDGLERAQTICRDDDDAINQTLEALESDSGLKFSQPTPTNSSECKWENEGHRKQFAAFVNDLENLVKQINSFGSN